MMTPRDVKTPEAESLSELHVPDADPLAPVEMGPADRETQGGWFGLNDFHFGWQG